MKLHSIGQDLQDYQDFFRAAALVSGCSMFL